jgi:hypothetical protein
MQCVNAHARARPQAGGPQDTEANGLLAMPEIESESDDDDRTIFAICSAALNEAGHAPAEEPHQMHLQALERELAAKTVQLADCEARLRAYNRPTPVVRCLGTQTDGVGITNVAAATSAMAAPAAARAVNRKLPTTRSTVGSRDDAPSGSASWDARSALRSLPPMPPQHAGVLAVNSSGRSTPNPPKPNSKRSNSLGSNSAVAPVSAEEPMDTALRRLGEDPSLSIMHMVMRQAQLEAAISSNKEGWSLFVPTDDAFLKLQGVATVQAILASKSLCAKLTLHHLCDTAVPNANGWFRSGSAQHVKVKSIGAVPPPLPVYFEGEPASVGRVLRDVSVGRGRLLVCDSVLWLPRALQAEALTLSNVTTLGAAHADGLAGGDDYSDSMPYSDSGLDLSYLTADCDLTWGQAPDLHEELIDEVGSETTEWATLCSGENTKVQSSAASPERAKERAALSKSTPKALRRSIKKLEITSSKVENTAPSAPAASADERQALKLAKWAAKLEEYQRQSLKGAKR